MSRRWYWWAAGGIVLILLILLVDKAEDVLSHIEYPMDVWRMDLDDMLANVGFFLVGIAAFASLWVKAGKAHDKADEVSKEINGGLEKLATQHVAAATLEAQEAGHYVELLGRVTAIEKERDDCHEELAEVRVEMGQIQDWVVTRLDKSGNGRSEAR